MLDEPWPPPHQHRPNKPQMVLLFGGNEPTPGLKSTLKRPEAPAYAVQALPAQLQALHGELSQVGGR